MNHHVRGEKMKIGVGMLGRTRIYKNEFRDGAQLFPKDKKKGGQSMDGGKKEKRGGEVKKRSKKRT